MTDPRDATPLAALVALAALVFTACGGGTSSATTVASAQAPVPPASEAPASEVPATQAPASQAPASESPASRAPLPSIELSGLVGGLANVNSYRITVSLKGAQSYLATIIQKPRPASAITMGTGTDMTKIIKVGDKAWLATGGSDTYQEVPASTVDPLIRAFDPMVLLGPFADGNIGSGANDLGGEQKNGIDSHHYRVDRSSRFFDNFDLPPTAAIEFWVADDGYLVAYEFSGAGADLSIDISNVNDPANAVTPPG